MEQALIGTPVADVDMPINALRTVHSFDPCTACAVHVTERGTGKHFETVTSLGGEVRWPISLTTKRPILLSSW